MSNLTDKIEADLKQAMIAGDKKLVSVLRGAKSALQYARVDAGSELSEETVVKVLQKESKKRADAISLYEKAGDNERADNEKYEKEVIDKYLPEQLSKEEITKLVDEVINTIGTVGQKDMGRIINEVRQKSNGQADGAMIAAIAKERLTG